MRSRPDGTPPALPDPGGGWMRLTCRANLSAVTIRRIAFFAFPRLTLLDLVGGYDALRRVEGVECAVVGTADEVGDDGGMRIRVDEVYPALDSFDLLYVPGGLGADDLVHDERAIEYLRGWGRERPIASVCSGALLLGAAGHLDGLRATTHHFRFEQLAPHCREVVRNRRVVDEGRVVTAAGVSASLDLGLHLVGKHWGDDARVRIAEKMELLGGRGAMP